MRLLLAIIFIASFFGAEAQKFKDPRQYYRQFSNENRKIKRKALMYYEASLKGEDERRVAKYREMVIDQLKDSKKQVERVGPYEDYEILQREYSDALEMYIDGLEKDMEVAMALKDSMYQNWEYFRQYQDALAKAENKMLDAEYKMEAAEKHFAQRYYVDRMVDESTEEKFRKLDAITPHVRDMSMAFYRVHMPVQNFLDLIESDEVENKADTLPRILTQIKKNIRTGREEIAEWSDFEDKGLYKETLGYMEEIDQEVEGLMRPLAESLSNEYLGENEYQKARKQLERFKSWYSGLVEDWKEEKTGLVEDYLKE